ncbi:hypothetical protein P0W64_13530 [Tsukamurella sp. 8F]|uniref:hypothetical protein n=1 Tax=unclassified Tsukamurella TaxID=2633480 RepID=UPI0023B9BBAE|nr:MULTISPECIES: hypothetical protein [unclassified Tsukamurella]MDF0530593.1 hypothetical protein [Tsukamurella sp. 8J]MDF0587794.1 hypothetical protein [Tsukamurella sp. 8F]
MLRGAAAGAGTAALAVTAHAAAAGMPVPDGRIPMVAVVAVLVGAVAARVRSVWGLTGVFGAGQLAVHLLLATCGGHMGDPLRMAVLHSAAGLVTVTVITLADRFGTSAAAHLAVVAALLGGLRPSLAPPLIPVVSASGPVRTRRARPVSSRAPPFV